MTGITNEQIGRLAQLIAATDFSLEVGAPFNRPLFRAVALGDKYPVADLLVDTLDASDRPTGFFLVQVKGTRATQPHAPRLPIDVPLERFNQLVRLPLPAYLVAVDVALGRSFLVGASRRRKRAVASVAKEFPLRQDSVKIALYRELMGYWATREGPRHTSEFHDG